MKQLILTIVGPDKPGLVDGLSQMVLEHKGNWLKSDLSHLAGQFAGIVQIEIDDNNHEALCHAVEGMVDLDIRVHEGRQEEEKTRSEINFAITGNDRPGIVQELSSVLAQNGANIVHFTSAQQSAPNWGSPMFNAVATVSIPEDVDKETLIESVEALANDLVIDIEE
ncbi:glycine cleavage system protein R [Algicola sagamiensis]|uniref:glycine cleavage system protein R n=1 Tax=Algicola sagamiensis TaxID=163869 RepID=UPI00036528C8|nr:ACT domain-containing protein [Algicola sagamiensis]